jgi:antitoxin StbD
MAHMVPITEAKTRLSELVRDASDEDVLLLRHGRPAAVLVSAERHEALLDEIEDLRDRLSIYERERLTVDWEQAKAELAAGHNQVA